MNAKTYITSIHHCIMFADKINQHRLPIDIDIESSNHYQHVCPVKNSRLIIRHCGLSSQAPSQIMSSSDHEKINTENNMEEDADE